MSLADNKSCLIRSSIHAHVHVIALICMYVWKYCLRSRCSLLFHANLEVKAHGETCPFTSTDNVLNDKDHLASCGHHCRGFHQQGLNSNQALQPDIQLSLKATRSQWYYCILILEYTTLIKCCVTYTSLH